MIKAIGNTVGTYAGPFAWFSFASVTTIFLFAPGINPYAIGNTITQRQVFQALWSLVLD